MTKFYKVSDNSLHIGYFPWVARIVSGVQQDLTVCPTCGTIAGKSFMGDLRVTLEQEVGYVWADLLGCGPASLFIASQRVLETWKSEGIGDFPIGGQVLFEPPLPNQLQRTDPPRYFWLEGRQMCGARIDDLASGIVGLKNCVTCHRGTFDVVATYHRQNSQPWSYVFEPDSWAGANLFTTSTLSSSGRFFCTEEILTCARKYRHTNFRFVPIEEGDAPGSGGIKYL